MSRPKIHVRPATPSDIPAMNRIRDLAFMPGPVSRAMFRGPVDPSTSAHRAEEMAREMGQPQYRFVVACLGENPGSAASVAFPSTGNPAQSADIAGDEALAEAAGADGAMAEPTLSSAPTLDAVDEKAGEKSEVKSNRPGTVVAYVKWSEFLDARSKSEWDVPLEVNRETVGPGIDLEIYDAFIGGLKNLRRRMIQGDPHLIISMLCTSPYHQRLGAGSALVSAFLERLDSLNAQRRANGGGGGIQPLLDGYLEASPPGYPVYSRLGFEDLEVLDLDLKTAKIEKSEAERSDSRSWGGEYGREVGGEPGEGIFRTVLMVRKGIST